MAIKLSDHFSYRKLLMFVLPSIFMMIFTSIYGVVDGFFVSNFAGKLEFAAVNLIMPFPMLLGAFGFMIGTGGSALVAIALGEGRGEDARQIFSMLVYVTIGAGVLLSVPGILFLEEIAMAMGAEGALLPLCVDYGQILLIGLTPFMIQNVFQSFLVTAERPDLGLKITVLAGLTNIILDILLIGVLHGGVKGAALATIISQFVGGLIPLFFFARNNGSPLRLVRTGLVWDTLWRTCFNGSSELMTNLSMSLVNMLYNVQLLKFAGEDGVAAYGVIMYVNFIFVAVFIGYSIGSAPIVGYHYGAGNRPELQSVYRKSIKLNLFLGIAMCAAALALSGGLAALFVGYDPDLCRMTKEGFRIYSLSFVVMGLNIYASSFFTALGNGLVSAFISFLRTLLFQLVCVLALPVLFGLEGIWAAVVAAECAALVISFWLLFRNQKRYGY